MTSVQHEIDEAFAVDIADAAVTHLERAMEDMERLLGKWVRAGLPHQDLLDLIRVVAAAKENLYEGFVA